MSREQKYAEAIRQAWVTRPTGEGQTAWQARAVREGRRRAA